MTNQLLRRVDPLGRSAPPIAYTPNNAWLAPTARGSAWPISRGSMRAIVDTFRRSPPTRHRRPTKNHSRTRRSGRGRQPGST